MQLPQSRMDEFYKYRSKEIWQENLGKRGFQRTTRVIVSAMRKECQWGIGMPFTKGKIQKEL